MSAVFATDVAEGSVRVEVSGRLEVVDHLGRVISASTGDVLELRADGSWTLDLGHQHLHESRVRRAEREAVDA